MIFNLLKTMDFSALLNFIRNHLLIKCRGRGIALYMTFWIRITYNYICINDRHLGIVSFRVFISIMILSYINYIHLCNNIRILACALTIHTLFVLLKNESNKFNFSFAIIIMTWFFLP